MYVRFRNVSSKLGGKEYLHTHIALAWIATLLPHGLARHELIDNDLPNLGMKMNWRERVKFATCFFTEQSSAVDISRQAPKTDSFKAK